MKVVWRDDDICFYTKPEQLNTVYGSLNMPVVFGVVPFGVGEHRGHKIYGEQNCYESRDISENPELVTLLSRYLTTGSEIALHGYDHAFGWKKNRMVSMMSLLPINELEAQIRNGRQHLSSVFGVDISTFIPPTNLLTPNMVRVIEHNHLDLFGLIYLFDRPFHWANIPNLIKRWSSRFKYGTPMCGLLDYGCRKELWSFHAFSFKQMVADYTLAKSVGVDVSFATHYWELLQDDNLREDFFRFVDFVRDDGGEFSNMRTLCGRHGAN